jgi:hypothetical protein
MSTTYPTLAEASEMELAGAVSRLMLAREAFENFKSRTMVVTCEDADYYSEQSKSLEREMHGLLLELDEAERRYRHAFDECVKHAPTQPGGTLNKVCHPVAVNEEGGPQ